MIIRIAKESDLQAIARLWLQLVEFHQAIDARMPQPAANGQDEYIRRLRFSLQDDSAQIYVADDDGVIAGYILGIIVDLLPDMFAAEEGGMIADIFVLPDYRSQGIGQSLVQQMRDWFSLRGISHYEWYVASENAAGIHFWQDVIGGEPVMLRMRAPVDDGQ